MSAPSGVTILGAGAWGTALAQHLAANGAAVTLWGRDPDALETIERTRRNQAYLPGVVLSPSIKLQNSLPNAVSAAELLVFAVPCAAMRAVAGQAADEQRARGVIWTCKGVEAESGMLMHEVLEGTLGGAIPTACLSGPSFADEVALGMPTAVVLAADDGKFAEYAAGVFHAEGFRVYTNDDVPGVEVAGAIKNVIAIAAGICDGLKLGDNARAALVTRGIAETTRLALAAGGQARTMSGLAGVGDMMLTCLSGRSRNYQFGLSLVAGNDHPAGLVSKGDT